MYISTVVNLDEMLSSMRQRISFKRVVVGHNEMHRFHAGTMSYDLTEMRRTSFYPRENVDGNSIQGSLIIHHMPFCSIKESEQQCWAY